MPSKSERPELKLDEGQRTKLLRISQSRRAAVREVQRASILLKYSEGESITGISEELSTTYFDQNGEPAMDQTNVHQYRFIYGNHCSLLERQIWNASNEPDTSTLGLHIERYIYDEDNNFLRTESLDKSGEVIGD